MVSRAGARHLAVSTWHLALGTWHLALGTWHLALGTWHLALGTWHLALGTWHLALGTWISHRKVFCRDRGPSTPARKRGALALRMTREMDSSSSEKRRAKSE